MDTENNGADETSKKMSAEKMSENEDEKSGSDKDAEEDTGCDGCQAEQGGAEAKKNIPRSQKKKIARMKKRERLKELRKEKKELRRQAENKRCDEEPSAADDSEPHVSKRQRVQEIRERLDQGLLTGQRIAVDLSMEHLMSEKECNKLAQQINRVYGANKQLSHPAHLYLTGLKKDGLMIKELHNKCAGFENYKIDVQNESHLDVFKPDEIVYLSPDSDTVLQSVDPDKVYIIGGLVDEHIQKGVTHSNAKEHRICSARLPIDEYLTKSEQGTYKKVLAINQVFDILMKYTECRDWTESLQVGVARRFGFVPKTNDSDEASSVPCEQSNSPADS